MDYDYQIKYEPLYESFDVYGCLNDEKLGVNNRRASRKTLREVMELIQADMLKSADYHERTMRSTRIASAL